MNNNRKVYLINSLNRGAVYGVGKYLRQLSLCLKQANIKYAFVNLYSDGIEPSVSFEQEEEVISIPYDYNSPSHAYLRNAAYILKAIIGDEKCIFHFNFVNQYELTEHIKKLFDVKIVLTIHYMRWTFSLKGDLDALKLTLQKDESLLSEIDKKVLDDYSHDMNSIQQADYVICVAHHIQKKISSLIDSMNNVSVVYNGLKDSFSELTKESIKEIRKKYHIDPETKVILFVGRFDEIKGYDLLIKSFNEVLQFYSDVHLVLVGDGDYNKLLESIHHNWKRISFTGYLNEKDLYELYAIADMGVVPSLYEDFGYVAIEMMMYCLPVIVTDIGGLSEIVVDNVSGLKIPALNNDNLNTVSQILCEKIIYLLENEHVSRDLGITARERFLKCFELSAFKENMTNLYKKIETDS